MGKHDLKSLSPVSEPRIRIEIIGTRQATDQILAYLADEILPRYYATACIETVDVLRLEAFTAMTGNPSETGAHAD
jgi:hypothetical protein